MLLLFPQQNIAPPQDTASFLLLPRFLHFPLGASLPIGLVLDPKHMNGRKFHNLVAFLSGHTALNRTQWLSNVFVDAWFAAVRTHPEKFQNDAFPHSIIQEAFPTSGWPTTLSFRLHLEWSLATQILWDQAFAQGNGTNKDSSAATLTAYAKALLAANKRCGTTQ
jgi:hypothetical protein